MRAAHRVARMERPVAACDEESAAIRQRLSELETVSQASRIHVFWPIHEKREVDLRPLIREWLSAGRTVWVPIVPHGVLPGRHMLAGRLVSEADDLEPGPFGTLQPTPDDTFNATSVDVIIVPALAADRSGTRLGYGGGYYDRFLSAMHIPTVCPIFHHELLPYIPREDHDVRVDHIVTSRETVRTTSP